jgi:predicted ATPase
MFGFPGVDDRELLEREQGSAALAQWLDGIERSGAGRVVFVAGEAGVGKTVLVRRFCGGLRGPRVLWGGCDPLATPAPLEPLVDVAGELDGCTAALLATARSTRGPERCSMWSR